MTRKPKGKNPNGAGSIFQTKNGWYQVAVTIPRSGGKRLKGKAPTMSLALVLRDQLREKAREGVVKAGNMTVSDVIELYLSARQFSPNTLSSYRNAAKNLGAIGGERIATLTPLDVERWIGDAKARLGKGRACELAALMLRRACDHAVSMDLIPKSPFRSEIPRADAKEIQPFTESEAAKIVQAAIDVPMGGVIVLAIGCGMRQGEIFGLQWGDVDFDARSVRITRQVTECKGSQVVKEPKTKRSVRSVALPEAAIQALQNQRKECMRRGAVQPTDWVFPSKAGKPYRRTNFARRHWKPLLKKLRLHPRGLHAGRHTAATLLLQRNIPVIAVAEMLGHSRPSVTHDRYSHYVGGVGRDAASAMDSVLGCSPVAQNQHPKKTGLT